jgi:hypothetical protein
MRRGRRTHALVKLVDEIFVLEAMLTEEARYFLQHCLIVRALVADDLLSDMD